VVRGQRARRGRVAPYTHRLSSTQASERREWFATMMRQDEALPAYSPPDRGASPGPMSGVANSGVVEREGEASGYES
jgi:hypothetical protein